MATLNGGISASATTIRVAGGSLAIPGNDYRIDDEAITLRSFAPYPTPWSPPDATRWRVSRGRNGSTAATHSNGATIYGLNAEPVTTGVGLPSPTPFQTDTFDDREQRSGFLNGRRSRRDVSMTIGIADWATGDWWQVDTVRVGTVTGGGAPFSGDTVSGSFAQHAVGINANDHVDIAIRNGGYMLDSLGGSVIVAVGGGSDNRVSGAVDVWVVITTPDA